MKFTLSNKEEILWGRRISNGLVWRSKFSNEAAWPSIDRIFRSDYGDLESTPRFNLIYMMGQTLIPNIVFQSPGVINTAVKPELTFLASIWDSIDNMWIKHSEMRDVLKEVALSSFLYNTTAVQIGYDFDTNSDKLGKDQEFLTNLKGVTNRSRATNLPWLDVIQPHRFITGVGTKTMRDCCWAAKLVSAPVASLKKIPGLKNVTWSKLPDEILKHEMITWENRDRSKWCNFWQIHDAETGKWCWLSTSGKFLFAPEDDPLQVLGLPFEVVSFNQNLQSIFGTPDSEYIRTQHQEGEEVRRDSMYMRRFSLPKFVYDSNVIKPEDVESLLSAQVAPGIPANLGESGEDDIRKHLYVFTPPTSLTLHQQYTKELLNDAQLITGFGPNQMGTFAPGRRTKYETQVVESTNSSRTAFRRNYIANMAEGLIKRANILISQNWSSDMVTQVIGVDGAIYWVKVTPQELSNVEDGLVTEVNVESLAPVSRERRKMEAGNLLNMLGSMVDAGVNPMPIIKQLLSQYEWIDIRQVLPQMTGEYELAAWTQVQEDKLKLGTAGKSAQTNLQGVTALAERLPAEQNGAIDETNND